MGMLKSLSKIEIALLVALILMVISILLPWVSINTGWVGFSVSGWDISWTTKLVFFLALISGALFLYKREAGLKTSLVLSGLTVVYIIFRLISPPKIGTGFGVGIQLSISKIFDYAGVGLYLFIIASIAVLVISIKILKKNRQTTTTF